MMEADIFITSLDEDQKSLFLNIISFTKGFSINWFPDIPASKMTGLVLKLSIIRAGLCLIIKMIFIPGLPSFLGRIFQWR